MNRAELEHVIRAAAEVTGDDVVVVGSQAILAAFPDAPAPLRGSMEADVYPRSRPADAIRIDGALGENSMFNDAYGYYAHGVGPETVVGPIGWEARLIPVEATAVVPGQPARIGWCLEPHDLVVAKLAAGRDNDLAFAEEALRAGLVDPATLEERAATVAASHRDFVRSNLRAAIARARG